MPSSIEFQHHFLHNTIWANTYFVILFKNQFLLFGCNFAILNTFIQCLDKCCSQVSESVYLSKYQCSTLFFLRIDNRHSSTQSKCIFISRNKQNNQPSSYAFTLQDFQAQSTIPGKTVLPRKSTNVHPESEENRVQVQWNCNPEWDTSP